MKSRIKSIGNEKLSFDSDNTPFFSSAGQRKATRALNELLDGALDLVLINGDLGTGKTRVLSNYLSSIADQAKTAVIAERLDSPMEFLHAVAVAFDGIIHGDTPEELHSALMDFLIEQHVQGEQFVLAVDNAQNMDDSTFELVQSLSELESRDQRILNLVLLSRNGAKINRRIRELCHSADLSALDCELTPFTEIETRAYISEQLSRTVEYTRLQLTTTGGRRVHYYSGGNPLLIDILTDLSAQIALKAEQTQITRKVVQHAIRTPQWVKISETIPGIHIVKVPGNDERGQYAIPKVIVFDDETKLSEHELGDEKTWLGRDTSSDIRLARQSVSRRHALITKEGGNVWISNLNNINGTQVNSKSVLRRVLLDGDVIRVANFLLLFVYEEAAHSSGHLKEVTETDAEPLIDETLNEERDNVFDLPSVATNERMPAYQAIEPLPPKKARAKTPFITVSTIASIGLITGAIVISQNGMQTFDISFPKGGSTENEIPPATQSESQIDSSSTPAVEKSSQEIPAVDKIVAVNDPAAEEKDVTQKDLTATEPTESSDTDLNLPPTPVYQTQEPTISEPVVSERTVASNDVPLTIPPADILHIQPVQEIFSPTDINAVTIATDFVDGPQSEAGFSDLVNASPGAESIFVKDDAKFDNAALLSDRRFDSVSFAWNDIDDLLQRGQQQLAGLKLTIPADDNAYDTFSLVLSLDPGNAEALAGLDQIAERYYNIATASKDRFNFAHAQKMTNRGIEVVPQHQGLLDLADELTILAANTQSRPIQIQKAESIHIEKVPEAELNKNFGIVKMADGELDALYAFSDTQYIEPVTTPRSFSVVQNTSNNEALPIFINQSRPVTTSAAVSTPYIAPAQQVATQLPATDTANAVTQSPVVVVPQPQAASALPVQQIQATPAVVAPSVQQVQQQAPVQVVAQKPQIIPSYLPGTASGSQAANTQTQTPKPAPISGETILNVDHLLKKASRLQSIGHYTGPANENALDTYKRILSLEPLNPDALIGLLDIADYYYRESEKMLLLGDPLSSLAMIEQGLKVRPDHKGLRQLQTNAQLLLQKDAKERGIGTKNISPSERKTVKAKRHIDKLVNDARDRLNEKEYSKSLSIIEQGLKLDPDNPDLISIRSEALQSLASLEKKWGEEQRLREQNLARQQRVKYEVNEKKAERLLSKARKEFSKGNYQAAHIATRNGLLVMPENVKLIALQGQIENTWDKKTQGQANNAVNSVVTGIVNKARNTYAEGDIPKTLGLIKTGLVIDPQNVELRGIKLEIHKASELKALQEKTEARLRELETQKTNELNALQKKAEARRQELEMKQTLELNALKKEAEAKRLELESLRKKKG